MLVYKIFKRARGRLSSIASPRGWVQDYAPGKKYDWVFAYRDLDTAMKNFVTTADTYKWKRGRVELWVCSATKIFKCDYILPYHVLAKKECSKERLEWKAAILGLNDPKPYMILADDKTVTCLGLTLGYLIATLTKKDMLYSFRPYTVRCNVEEPEVILAERQMR